MYPNLFHRKEVLYLNSSNSLEETRNDFGVFLLFFCVCVFVFLKLIYYLSIYAEWGPLPVFSYISLRSSIIIARAVPISTIIP